jgi:hypothetical protein
VCLAGIDASSIPCLDTGVAIEVLLHPSEPRQGSSSVQAALVCADIHLVELTSVEPIESVERIFDELAISDSSPTDIITTNATTNATTTATTTTTTTTTATTTTATTTPNPAPGGDSTGVSTQRTTFNLPTYDPTTTVLLYPSEAAVWLDELDFTGVLSVVVVESPWRYSDEVAKQPSLLRLRHVKIRGQTATHWRHQPLGSSYLCTVEAIYYFLCARHTALARTAVPSVALLEATESDKTALPSTFSADPSDYSVGDAVATPFDDILFFYAHQHAKIRARYAKPTPGRPLRALKSWQPRDHRALLAVKA